MAGTFNRPVNIAWVGLSLAIVTTSFMVMTYLIYSGTTAVDPNSPTQREAGGCATFLLFLFLGFPSFIFALITCSLGLVSLVGSIREQRNLFPSIATLVLSVFCFVLFSLI